jgi:hypothetical protein
VASLREMAWHPSLVVVPSLQIFPIYPLSSIKYIVSCMVYAHWNQLDLER